jgi:hypothetical protein
VDGVATPRFAHSLTVSGVSVADVDILDSPDLTPVSAEGIRLDSS